MYRGEAFPPATVWIEDLFRAAGTKIGAVTFAKQGPRLKFAIIKCWGSMRAETEAKKARVGIVGVGNCASSFVQGLSYYDDMPSNEPAPGLMHAEIGDYRVRDIEISAA